MSPSSTVLQYIEQLLLNYRNPDRKKVLLDKIAATVDAASLPKEPPPALIESMCLRYAHDFGLDKDPDVPLSCGWTPEGREALRRTMRQLYEEVAGHGFYRP